MSDNAPDVQLKVTAEDQGVAAAIKQLTTQLQHLKDKEGEAAESTAGLGEAFEALVAVLAVEKLLEFGKEVFGTVNKIQKLNEVTGISTETLSVFASAATQSGVSFDIVGAGIQKLALVVTQFEQGNQKAAKAIALTGLKLQDLAGLNAEQKIRLIADAIAKMPPGFQRVAAEQKLLGDSSGDLNKVLNLLGGEGFDRVREEAEKAGTIVGTQTALDFENLRATMARLKEQSEGMALQFEAGLVPALTDVSNAIGRAMTTDGASSFKSLGELAGDAIKTVASFFTTFFAGLELLVNGPVDSIKNFAIFAEETLSLGPKIAAKNFAANRAASQKFLDDMVQSQLAAVRVELDGSTRLQMDALAKLKAAKDKAKGTEKSPENTEAIKGILKLQEQEDAAFKQRLSAKQKGLGEELTVTKAADAELAGEEVSGFDRGLITLTDYYAARKTAIENAAAEELSVLQRQRANEVAADARATSKLAINRGKAKGAGGTNTAIGQEFQAAAAKNLADQARARQAIADLDAKLTVQEIKNRTAIAAEDLDKYKAEQSQITKIAEFQRTILDIQGKTSEAAKVEADAKEAEYRLLLTSKFGAGSAEIELEVQKYQELTTAVGAFNETRKAGETAFKSLSDRRQAIQNQVATGQLFQIQADEKIRNLEASQIANLRVIAAAKTAAAAKTGNEADKAEARDFEQLVTSLDIASNEAMANVAQIKRGIEGGLSSSFETFFTSGITGARNLGQAFAGLADGIVSSLQKMAAQMLTTLITQKLLNAASGALGFSGGGSVGDSGGFGSIALAGGGIVSGPGTPTSDSIPARLSVGEFVFQESAVRAFGASTLAAMNRGLRPPAISTGLNVPKFAEGGLAQGGGKGADPARVHLQVGLDEGIVLKHLSSRKAGQVVVQHLANNPKQASKALGRSR